MRALLLVLAAMAPFAPPAQEAADTAAIRYKEFPAVLAAVAAAADAAAPKPESRVLVLWLIDNSSKLKTTRHDVLLANGIPRAFAKAKPGVHHAVMAFSDPPQLLLEPTVQTAAVAQTIEKLAEQKPDDRIKDCLETIRVAAKAMAGFQGKRLLVLFTPENGDNEDDVEETVKVLKNAGVALHAIAPEAVYSDPFWESLMNAGARGYYGDPARFKKLGIQMKGPDSAFIEFPYGWVLSNGDPSYTVPSGFPVWALGRLGATSGGRCYLYSPMSFTDGFCERFNCGVCTGEHRACGAVFDATKIRMTAPGIASRDQVREQLGKEKLTVALYAIWERLAKAGLLSYTPPLKPGGGGLVAASTTWTDSPLKHGANWKANAATAKELGAEAGRIIAELEKLIAGAKPETEMRAKAVADALLVHLRFLVFNLDQLRLFQEWMAERERKGHAHEAGFGGDPPGKCCGEGTYLGWHFSNVYICHGGASLKEMRILGGDGARKALHAVLDAADAVIEKHRGTPWEVLVRRASIAIYRPLDGQ